MSKLFDFFGMEICQFPCLADNYGFLVRDTQTGQCAAIDTPDARAISEVLEARKWRLTQIWNTHWHPDHTGGNLALKKLWDCEIIGPAAEKGKIPGADRFVSENDNVRLGKTDARVIETPGHTSGHIVYYLADKRVAFVGDTLFALGCGRLFEGTPAQMWASLKKLRALPDETQIFCAHEYTQANARFAVTIEPANAQLELHSAQINALRRDGVPTVPTTISKEKASNPFLRADQATVAAALNMSSADPVAIFAEIRQRKDRF